MGVEPAGISVTLASDPQVCTYVHTQPMGLVSIIAPDNKACMLQMQLTSFIICLLSSYISLSISTYRHPCKLHLHPTISHVCSNCTQSSAMPFTVAPNQLPCLLNLHLQACMSDTITPDHHSYFYINIQPYVPSFAFAPD